MSEMTSRVLLVDDDPALLEALAEAIALRLPSVITDACDSAEKALNHVSATNYDVIISDIKMPGMDGIGLLGAMKDILPDTPVLLITGHGETDLAIQALRTGAFDLIQKPLDRDYFAAALLRAIDVKRLKDQVAAQQLALQNHATELERGIQERTLELEKALQAKDEFLSLVSHELRNPMTVIMGNAEALHRYGDVLAPEARSEALTDLRLSTKRLMQLIENLLVMSKADYGIQDAEPVLLDKLIHAEVDWYRQFSAGRPILTTLPADKAPPTICSATHIALVLKNLIGNADKYSPAGEPIYITLERRMQEFVICVQDQGPGVPLAERELVFQPFYRSRATSDVNGMGIGLAVCKKLLKLNGGEVWIEDTTKGSTFCFSVPIVAPAMLEEDPELNLVPNVACI